MEISFPWCREWTLLEHTFNLALQKSNQTGHEMDLLMMLRALNEMRALMQLENKQFQLLRTAVLLLDKTEGWNVSRLYLVQDVIQQTEMQETFVVDEDPIESENEMILEETQILQDTQLPLSQIQDTQLPLSQIQEPQDGRWIVIHWSRALGFWKDKRLTNAFKIWHLRAAQYYNSEYFLKKSRAKRVFERFRLAKKFLQIKKRKMISVVLKSLRQSAEKSKQKLEHFQKQYLLFRFMKRWQALTQFYQRYGKQWRLASENTRLRVLFRVFYVWRDRMHEKRIASVKERLLNVGIRGRILFDVFTKWRERLLLIVINRQAESMHSRLVLKHFVDHWQGKRLESVARREKVQHVQSNLIEKTLNGAWRHWRASFFRERHLSHLLSDSLADRQQRLFQTTMNKWKQKQQRVLRQKQLQAFEQSGLKLFEQHQKRQMMGCFVSWHKRWLNNQRQKQKIQELQFVDKSRALSALYDSSIPTLPVLRLFFKRWHQRYQRLSEWSLAEQQLSEKKQSDDQLVATSKARYLHLRQCFKRWRQKREYVLLERVSDGFKRHRLLLRFKNWQQKTRSTIATTFERDHLLIECFKRWKQSKSRVSSLDPKCQQFLRSKTTLQQKQILLVWKRLFLKRSRQKLQAFLLMRSKRIKSCLVRWQNSVSDKRALFNAAKGFEKMKLTKRYFSTMTQKWDFLKLESKKGRLQIIVLELKRTKIQFYYDKWRLLYLKRQTIEARLQDFNRPLTRYLAIWQMRLKTRRKLEKRAKQVYLTSLLKQQFAQWNQKTRYSLDIQKREKQLYFQHRKQTIVQCLSIWRHNTHKKQQLKQLLQDWIHSKESRERIVEIKQKKRRKRLLMVWRQKYLIKRADIFKRQRLMKMLKRWHHLLVALMVDRQSLYLYQQRLVQLSLRCWMTRMGMFVEGQSVFVKIAPIVSPDLFMRLNPCERVLFSTTVKMPVTRSIRASRVSLLRQSVPSGSQRVSLAQSVTHSLTQSARQSLTQSRTARESQSVGPRASLSQQSDQRLSLGKTSDQQVSQTQSSGEKTPPSQRLSQKQSPGLLFQVPPASRLSQTLSKQSVQPIDPLPISLVDPLPTVVQRPQTFAAEETQSISLVDPLPVAKETQTISVQETQTIQMMDRKVEEPMTLSDLSEPDMHLIYLQRFFYTWSKAFLSHYEQQQSALSFNNKCLKMKMFRIWTLKTKESQLLPKSTLFVTRSKLKKWQLTLKNKIVQKKVERLQIQRVFSIWIKRTRDITQLLESASIHFNIKTKEHYLQSWINRQQNKRKQEHLLSSAILYHSMTLMDKLFKQWHSLLHLNQVSDHFFTKTTTKTYFGLWNKRMLLVESKRLKFKLSGLKRSVGSFKVLQMRKCFRRWKQSFDLNQKQKRMRQRVFFGKWKQSYELNSRALGWRDLKLQTRLEQRKRLQMAHVRLETVYLLRWRQERVKLLEQKTMKTRQVWNQWKLQLVLKRQHLVQKQQLWKQWMMKTRALKHERIKLLEIGMYKWHVKILYFAQIQQQAGWFDVLRRQKQVFDIWWMKMYQTKQREQALQFQMRVFVQRKHFKIWQALFKRMSFEQERKMILAETWHDKRLERKILMEWHQLVGGHLEQDYGSIIFI
ncbi:hypothetical protein EDD86DRAFT_255381 [Gorgonomyces haynaldii]|nr:hypothetical protein EDD86DRAFT_255381 [Gorgonomyces haynaldii]